MDLDNVEDFTLFVGNLDTKITEEILYELFLQAGPLKRVRIPIDHRTKKPQRFGFVTFKHICSVDYAIKLLNGIKLFNSNLNISKKKKKDLPTNGIAEEYTDNTNSQRFGERVQCHDAYDMQQGYMPSPLSNRGFHGKYASPMSSSQPIEHGMEMPSASQQMKRSQSFHNPNIHSPTQNNCFNGDDHHGGHRHNNGRHNSPHSLHHRHSPPVNELKRSKSYNTLKEPQKYRSERRFVDREESTQRHPPPRNDSRRVVSHSRHSRNSPYERSHHY